MQSNQKSITINAGAIAEASCRSRADYHQRVKLQQGATTVVFTGAGEDQPMLRRDNGMSVWRIEANGGKALEIVATFEYSESGANDPFKPSTVGEPIDTKIDDRRHRWDVATEDSNDHDNNDSTLTIIVAENQF